MRIGIIGAGSIAAKMAASLLSKPHGCECYAIASRDLKKAHDFAEKWQMPVAYGSYEELVQDKNVDLVYIATPHSHHYQHTKLALEHGKPCLVEKAFMANARETKEILALAKEKGLFITEAMWTRYMPMSHKVAELLASGVIGQPQLLTATLGYHIGHKERILRPELCGGALLDLGVYCLNFARMYFGADIARTISHCQLGETGVDLQESISLGYRNGRMANLQASALCLNDRQGIISGTEGYLRVDNINCSERLEVYRNNELTAVYEKAADMITGYEYEAYECQRCMKEGLLESPMMPHAETLSIMQQMDSLRAEWGVKYPMD